MQHMRKYEDEESNDGRGGCELFEGEGRTDHIDSREWIRYCTLSPCVDFVKGTKRVVQDAIESSMKKVTSKVLATAHMTKEGECGAIFVSCSRYKEKESYTHREGWCMCDVHRFLKKNSPEGGKERRGGE